MTRERYLMKQKVIGLVSIILGILLTLLFNIPAYLIMGPIGLLLLFTKESVLLDEHFYETEETE